MAEVLAALDAATAQAEARLVALEARGAREKAQADEKAQAAGQGMADDMKQTGEVGEGRGEYTALDDDAGRYLAERERLRSLQRRKQEIVGAFERGS